VGNLQNKFLPIRSLQIKILVMLPIQQTSLGHEVIGLLGYLAGGFICKNGRVVFNRYHRKIPFLLESFELALWAANFYSSGMNMGRNIA
jgi:hypothetical protein